MKQNALREIVKWLMEREDIRICTVYIKFFKPGVSDNDPIVLKFGHESDLGEKK